MREGQYDLDQQANGTCPFGFFCLEVCGSLVESVVVPVGQSRLVERGNLPGITVTQYTLRCVPRPEAREGRAPPCMPQRQSSPPKMFGWHSTT